jgi:hypothetical protein
VWIKSKTTVTAMQKVTPGQFVEEESQKLWCERGEFLKRGRRSWTEMGGAREDANGFSLGEQD